jgi:uncharacterized membrane protein
MGLGRALRHLFTSRWKLHRLFPPATLDAIEAAVHDGERGHHGEIRFAIETALDLPELIRGVKPRPRALEAFSHLRVWDTEHNNGVLIYLLLADRDVEIVADRGVAARVTQQEWEAVCRAMEAEFRAGRFEAGSVTGVHMVNELLARHYPAAGVHANELPDRPTLL